MCTLRNLYLLIWISRFLSPFDVVAPLTYRHLPHRIASLLFRQFCALALKTLQSPSGGSGSSTNTTTLCGDTFLRYFKFPFVIVRQWRAFVVRVLEGGSLPSPNAIPNLLIIQGLTCSARTWVCNNATIWPGTSILFIWTKAI